MHRHRVIPVYLYSPEEEGEWPPGFASRLWLQRSLNRLHYDLESLGSTLIYRKGYAAATLLQLCQETGAAQVFFNRRYEPDAVEAEQRVREVLTAHGIGVKSFQANLLVEPWMLYTRSQKPYQIFTPFWRHAQALISPASPLPSPKAILSPKTWPQTLDLKETGLIPKSAVHHPDLFLESVPGEQGAAAVLSTFMLKHLEHYKRQRHRADIEITSKLSPHLHFGEISPRQIWHEVNHAKACYPLKEFHESADAFLRQLGWREFSYYVLFHFPKSQMEPLKEQYRAFPWRRDAGKLSRWKQGLTGYPIVDAGMRQMLHTGWMHNQVRMTVASFLVKDLLIPWQEGARWFWDALVDADLADNTMGWQWVAGSGADASPYFRVFNPMLQGAKSDPTGEYVRRWVPELAALPEKWIHQPWKAPPLELKEAGVVLGKTYPRPMVNHEEARRRALKLFAAFKSAGAALRPSGA